MKNIFIASIPSIAIQPFLLYIFFAFPDYGNIPLENFIFISVCVSILSFIHFSLLGLPIFLSLKAKKHLSTWSVSISGFFIGILLISIVYLPPLNNDGYIAGNFLGHYQVFVDENKSITFYGWMNYIETVLWFGVQGATGALVFYYVWKRMQPKVNEQ